LDGQRKTLHTTAEVNSGNWLIKNLLQMINWEEFNSVYQPYGNELIIEIINMLDGDKAENPPAPSYEERMEMLKRRIDELDFKEIQWNLSSIIGLIRNFYDPVANAASNRLKEMGYSETSVGLSEEFEKFKIAADKLVIELREYRKTLTA
jgi:hypothetical protein